MQLSWGTHYNLCMLLVAIYLLVKLLDVTEDSWNRNDRHDVLTSCEMNFIFISMEWCQKTFFTSFSTTWSQVPKINSWMESGVLESQQQILESWFEIPIWLSTKFNESVKKTQKLTFLQTRCLHNSWYQTLPLKPARWMTLYRIHIVIFVLKMSYWNIHDMNSSEFL